MQRAQPTRFHPHGISLLKHQAKKYLFVVNHRDTSIQTVDIFSIQGDQLQLIHSVSDPLLIDPNDTFGIDENKFYVTNFSANNVLYFNGQSLRIVACDVGYANGINGDLNKKQLLVVSTSARKVYYYKIHEDGSLTKTGELAVGMFGDNLERDINGNYWLAGIPNPLKFFLHHFWQAFPAPSRVVMLPADQPESIVPIFYDNGKFISASSVAAPYQHEFLIGNVYSPFFARCQKKPPA
jgi:sugar lactone lactonase YvrE